MFISKVSPRQAGLVGWNILSQQQDPANDVVRIPGAANAFSGEVRNDRRVIDQTATVTEPSARPSIAEALADIARDYIVEVADTPELIREAQRLRYQVYCLEREFLSSDDDIEQDEYDAHSHHVILRRRSDREVVGTARLVLFNAERPDESYPTQHVCDAALLRCMPMPTTAEVSRFAISKELRGSSPALMRLALIEGLFRVSHTLGLTHWCATMERTLLRLLRSSAIHFQALGPLVEYHGPRQPCYANISEILERMRIERPEIWAFVTSDGLHCGDNTTKAVRRETRSVTRSISSGQCKARRDWQNTISGAAKFAFYPSFETADARLSA